MEKKAVMWDYPVGAERKVVGQKNVGKVKNTLTQWAAVNPCSTQDIQ